MGIQQSNGCQIGFFIPPDPEETYAARLAEFESLINRKPATVLLFINWNDLKTSNFPWLHFNEIQKRGAIPHLVWEPYPIPETPAYNIVDKILAGECDEYIRAFARDAKKFGAPFFLRPAHEMNAHWYGWGSAKNGGEHGAAQKYVALYRHIHDVFISECRDTVAWVWAPFAKNHPDEAWNDLTNYYPGDTYADWVGLDGYCWYPVYPYESFPDIYSAALKKVSALAPQKPVMIAEFSAQKSERRADWIREAFDTIKNNPLYSSVRALTWFNIDKTEEGHAMYWAVHPGTEDAAALRESLADPYFTDTGNTLK